MIGISISNQSNVPIYRQIYEQIRNQVLSGELENDFNLPPIRTAAKELRVSIITVKKAWEELERDGLIYSVVGRGCFIADLSDIDRSTIKKDVLRRRIETDIQAYKKLGASLADIIAVVKECYPNS